MKCPGRYLFYKCPVTSQTESNSETISGSLHLPQITQQKPNFYKSFLICSIRDGAKFSMVCVLSHCNELINATLFYYKCASSGLWLEGIKDIQKMPLTTSMPDLMYCLLYSSSILEAYNSSSTPILSFPTSNLWLNLFFSSCSNLCPSF